MGETLAEEFDRLITEYEAANWDDSTKEQAWARVGDFATDNAVAISIGLRKLLGEQR